MNKTLVFILLLLLEQLCCAKEPTTVYKTTHTEQVSFHGLTLTNSSDLAIMKINDFRRQNGKPPLRVGSNAGCVANNRLQQQRGMGHHKHGYSHRGECAATGNYQSDPLRAVNQWIRSAPHRRILLSGGSVGAFAATDRYATFQILE